MDERTPCGRRADWVTIGDVLSGGSDCAVMCHECYVKLFGRSHESGDDMVNARAFTEDVGRELLCDDEEGGLYRAFVEATKDVDDVPYTRREFALWLKSRAFQDKLHRIAIHRRFERVESWVGRLTTIASIVLAVYAVDRLKAWLPWLLSAGWAWGLAFAIAWLSLDRFLRLGRFSSREKIPSPPKSKRAPVPAAE